jgi:phosphoribosylformylglycinamidine cyclo-ligase
MPGFYQAGEYDLSGTIVGAVEKARMLDGKTIRRAMPSSAWHRADCIRMAIHLARKISSNR